VQALARALEEVLGFRHGLGPGTAGEEQYRWSASARALRDAAQRIARRPAA
jgi:hypothetical protein